MGALPSHGQHLYPLDRFDQIIEMEPAQSSSKIEQLQQSVVA
jgi:hypothetical protein